VFVFHRAENSWATDKTHPIASPTILCFDGSSGKLLASWGENRFVEPHGLRIDMHDNVWVTDRALQQVFKFSHDGRLLLTIGTERTAGLDGSHFNLPADLAFAQDGSIYVADGYGNNRIAKFSADGKFLLDWGRKGTGPGEFDLPHSVAADAQGLVYVADRNNARIQVFDSAEIPEDVEVTGAAVLGPSPSAPTICSMSMAAIKPRLQIAASLSSSSLGKNPRKVEPPGNYDGQIYWGRDRRLAETARCTWATSTTACAFRIRGKETSSSNSRDPPVPHGSLQTS
jgi:sugar lactone lactonase YvrE